MKYFFLIAPLIIVLGEAKAQPMTSESPYLNVQEEEDGEIETVLTLFDIPLTGSDNTFEKMSQFNFSAVRYIRRGYGHEDSKATLNGIELRDGATGRAYYGFIGELRKLRIGERMNSGLDVGEIGMIERYDSDVEMRRSNRVSVYGADRGYMFGLGANASGNLYKKGDSDGDSEQPKVGWEYALYASRRWGRDSHVDGVFRDEGGVTMMFNRRMGRELYSFVASVKPRQQGLRSASTREAFELTNNNLYNPTWGYYDGKARNSRVAGDLQPFILASYQREMNNEMTLRVSAAFMFGESYYTGFSWFDAQNPMPDYYREMPSENLSNLAELTAKWKSGDTAITQVDWEDMARRNSVGEAVFILENRIENSKNMQFAAEFDQKLSPNTKIHYGLRMRHDNKQIYKTVRDMLGASSFVDREQFLVNEEEYGKVYYNNLLNRAPITQKDENFGYSYATVYDETRISALLRHRRDRYELTGGAELGWTGFNRDGKFEKEMFEGDKSLGSSERVKYSRYKLKTEGRYSFARAHSATVLLYFAEDGQRFDNVFLEPRHSNEFRKKSPAIKLFRAK